MSGFRWGNGGGAGYGACYLPDVPPGDYTPPRSDSEAALLDSYRALNRYPTASEFSRALQDQWRRSGRTFATPEQYDRELWHAVQKYIGNDETLGPNPVKIRFPLPTDEETASLGTKTAWISLGIDRFGVFGLHFMGARDDQVHLLVFTDPESVRSVLGRPHFAACNIVASPAVLARLWQG